MDYRNLGRSGLRVSEVGLGCNNFGGRLDFEGTRAVVHAALDQGITLFDTADMYGNRGGSETALGELLGARRKDIVLASKFGMAMDDQGVLKGGSRRYVMSAVEASLKRLRTDWLDLYQFHTPDPLTPLDETMRALDDLVRQGKVRYIGCSNMPAWQVVDAQWIAASGGLTPFVSCQDEYSLLVRGVETDLFPAMRAKGLGLLPFYPLAGGLLTGKYRRGVQAPDGTRFKDARFSDRYMTDANWTKVETLQAIADELGMSLLDLSFAWLLSHAEVSSVIAGATRVGQIAANVAAGARQLSPEIVARIDAAT